MEILKELINPVSIWFLIGLFCLILELMEPGLIFSFFGIGAWIVALMCYFTDISINTQLFLFIISSALSLLLLRRWFKKILSGHIKARQNPEKDLDDFIGEKAEVKEKITPKENGKVEFHGTLWEAESNETIEVGTTVQIFGKNNLTLKVKTI